MQIHNKLRHVDEFAADVSNLTYHPYYRKWLKLYPLLMLRKFLLFQVGKKRYHRRYVTNINCHKEDITREVMTSRVRMKKHELEEELLYLTMH